MGLLNNTVLNKNLVKIKLLEHNAESALRYLADLLEKEGVVKESFSDAVVEREKVFPTGLNFGGYGIAIPHTDSEHVIQQAISIATLKEAIPFLMMGSDSEVVYANMIVMLAVKNPEHQVKFLQALMNVFQDKKLIRSFDLAGNPEDLLEAFKKGLESMEET